MTDPKWARATDHGRYYEDPASGEHYVSVTNALDELAIRGLAPSAANLTTKYFMEHLPEAQLAAADPDSAVREAFERTAKKYYETEWERRRDLGSRIHHAAEMHVLGGQQRNDPEVMPYLGQYMKFLADYQIDLSKDIESAETTVLNRRRGYGCTADLWIHLTPGDPHPAGLWLIDIKTSINKPASTIYPQMVLQLAANRYGEVALDPFDREYPVPEFVGTAILNLRPWSYGLVPVDADHNAYRAFVSLLPTVQFLHGLDLTPYKPINPKWRKPRNWDKKQKEVAA